MQGSASEGSDRTQVKRQKTAGNGAAESDGLSTGHAGSEPAQAQAQGQGHHSIQPLWGEAQLPTSSQIWQPAAQQAGLAQQGATAVSPVQPMYSWQPGYSASAVMSSTQFLPDSGLGFWPQALQPHQAAAMASSSQLANLPPPFSWPSNTPGLPYQTPAPSYQYPQLPYAQPGMLAPWNPTPQPYVRPPGYPGYWGGPPPFAQPAWPFLPQFPGPAPAFHPPWQPSAGALAADAGLQAGMFGAACLTPSHAQEQPSQHGQVPEGAAASDDYDPFTADTALDRTMAEMQSATKPSPAWADGQSGAAVADPADHQSRQAAYGLGPNQPAHAVAHAASGAQQAQHETQHGAQRSAAQDHDQPGGRQEASNGSRSPADRAIVLIWDLDETLIVLHSLLNGAWPAAYGQNTAAASQILGDTWQDAILSLCDNYLFFSELEARDQDTLTSLSRYDDGASLVGYDFSTDGMARDGASDAGQRKAAYRYRHISGLYLKGLEGIVTSRGKLHKYAELYRETDELSGGWLLHGRSLLSSCSSHWPAQQRRDGSPQRAHTDALQAQHGPRAQQATPLRATLPHGVAGQPALANGELRMQPGSGGSSPGGPHIQPASGSMRSRPRVHHVVVTAGQLIPTVGKLLAFRLDPHFAPADIYSSRNHGKGWCFDMIQARFGKDSQFCVIGDGPEEESAAAARDWPFVRVLLTPVAKSAAAPPDANVSAYATALTDTMAPDATGTLGHAFLDLTVDTLAQVVADWWSAY